VDVCVVKTKDKMQDNKDKETSAGDEQIEYTRIKNNPA
jgi:hypothetical protein